MAIETSVAIMSIQSVPPACLALASLHLENMPHSGIYKQLQEGSLHLILLPQQDYNSASQSGPLPRCVSSRLNAWPDRLHLSPYIIDALHSTSK
eukprot:6467986-Amphidinium_carterae.1